MNVSQLIGLLTQLPQDALVIMSSDAEGNGYSPVSSHDTGVYVPDTTWSGTFYSDAYDYDEYEPQDNEQLAVVLWPVN